MEKKLKLSYDPPKVTSVTFKVENGMTSVLDAHTLFDFGEATWDPASTTSSTNHFGDAGWSSGSSQGTNNFGSGSWDY